VATQNGTTLLITPRAKVIGHAINVTYSVGLNIGETYSCQDTTALAPTKLAGSIISSDKPVAVTVTSNGVRTSTASTLSSIITDQITTSSYAGTDFIVNRGNTGQDKVFILATVNSTSIVVNNGGPLITTLINTGQTFTVDINQPLTYIQTTKPVYALHVSGFGNKLSGSQMPSLYCMGTYTTAFTRTSSDSFAVNLYTRNGYQSMFTLVNSVTGTISIPASNFTVVPGTSGGIYAGRMYYTTAQIPVGSHNRIINTGDIFGCGINQGSSVGASIGSTYEYLSEFAAYPLVNAGLDGTICSNTSYSLTGMVLGGNVNGTWSTSGFGTFTAGTTSLINVYKPSPLDTAVKPVKLILTSNGPCPVRVDTLNLTVKQGPIVNASIDQVKCGNNATVTLNGSVTGYTTTGQWSSLGTGVFSPTSTALNGSYIPSSADTSAGSVTLILTSLHSPSLCAQERDTMKVTITKPPLVNAGPTSVSVCVNNYTINLNGSVTGSSTSGKWTTSGSGFFSPNNLALNTIYLPSSSDISATTLTLTLQSTNNGNCNPVKDSIQVVFTPKPSVNAGPDFFSCKNASIFTLNGSISGATSTGTWSGGGGLYNPNNAALNATYVPTPAEVAAGSVILTLTSTNNGNCLSVNDQVKIDFKDKPTANFASNVVCLKQGTLFTDFSNTPTGTIAGWDWTFGDGGVASVANPVYTYTTAGTYTTTLIVKNSYNCYDTVKKPVNVNPLPKTYFSFSRSCFGSALQLTFKDSSQIASPDMISSYYWDYGGLGSSFTVNPVQVFPFPGNYNITHIVTSNNGCRDTLVKLITINPRPVAGFIFTNNGGINLNSLVTFTDQSQNAVNWSWNFGDGNSSTIQNPLNTYYANGNYTVTQVVKDQFGCADTASAIVKILNVFSEITQLIPNAISPNGDGKNDIWRLDFINAFYPNAEIEIYNRWGEQLFRSIGYSNAWDGSYKGAALPVATYYYIINLKDPDPSKQSIFKGTVLLIK
ncbi:MAG: PKD domain-containing protein, partial [Bacteroidia bacterium]